MILTNPRDFMNTDASYYRIQCMIVGESSGFFKVHPLPNCPLNFLNLTSKNKDNLTAIYRKEQLLSIEMAVSRQLYGRSNDKQVLLQQSIP